MKTTLFLATIAAARSTSLRGVGAPPSGSSAPVRIHRAAAATAATATATAGGPIVPIVPTPSPTTGINPTHYGPTSRVGGRCLPDEAEWGWPADNELFCKPNKSCNSDADCPQDKPTKSGGVGAKPHCFKYDDIHMCNLSCNSDEDCQEGATCGEDHGKGKLCVYNPVSDCFYLNGPISGQWQQVQSSPAAQTVSYQQGVTRSYTVSDSESWGSKVSASASLGFSVFGIKIGSVGVSGEVAKETSRSYESTFSQSDSTTNNFSFGPGVVWQWVFTIPTGCGKTVASRADLQLTAGAFAPPCCLPGYFNNITDPTGTCHDGPNLCAANASRAFRSELE